MEQFKYYAPTKILSVKIPKPRLVNSAKRKEQARSWYTSEAAVPKNPVCLIVSAAHCRKQDCTM